MINAVCHRPLRLLVIIGLFSACHLDSPHHHHSMAVLPVFDHLLLLPDAEDSTPASASPAHALIRRLDQEAARVITPAPAEQTASPPASVLPPLPVLSHLSVFASVSPDGQMSAETFTSDVLPLTPVLPALFTETDEFGTHFGFDMGLTDAFLPAAGSLDWPLSVQDYCMCPGQTGLHQTTEATARLDFATGRFRLAAGFTGTNLRSTGMDVSLDRTRLLNRQTQPATTELSFTDRSPVRLDGELDLYLSGRTAGQIGGRFSFMPEPMDLSVILFLMHFTGAAP